MQRALALFTALVVASAARAEEPAAPSPWTPVGLGLLAGGAAVAASTMVAYQFLQADPALVDGEAPWVFDDDGPTREQVAGVLGVSGAAAGVVLILTGVAIVAGQE